MTAANPLGGLIGAFTGAKLLKCFKGIRKSLLFIDFLSIISTIIIIIDTNIINVTIGRLLCGICAGFNSALCPLYIREFSPIEISGRTGTFSQLF